MAHLNLITSSVDDQIEQSFEANENAFIRGDIAIHRNGVAMRHSAKSFTVSPNDIKAENVIGRGGSGFVMSAVHVPTGTRLALKIINIYDKSKRDQFVREIRTLYDSNCPCVIGFYGAFYGDGMITIALEYMDGGSLDNVIKQVGFVPEKALANLIYQVLWGLAYMQNEGRVHRDIKPSNMLINSEGVIKLSDFGICKDLQNSIAMCATFVGTFKYMSPERIEHRPYSYASDIWSVGLVLYECATGKFPYEDKVNGGVLAWVQTIRENETPRLPRKSPTGGKFSPQMQDVLGKCLRPDPKQRDSAQQLMQHEWFRMHGCVDLDSAVANVRSWIQSQ
mmetsp:Transcript_15264/g.24802  ORF Transcript_15264/g.24802 Transcript_15264/m.24802 type:complete len:336 (+) Transcript_15264:136-1143(+)